MTTIKLNLGTNSFEAEGPDLNLIMDTFKLWLSATSQDQADAAALVETLKAKGHDISKFADSLVAMAAKMDATAPTPPTT